MAESALKKNVSAPYRPAYKYSMEWFKELYDAHPMRSPLNRGGLTGRDQESNPGHLLSHPLHLPEAATLMQIRYYTTFLEVQLCMNYIFY
jgi:hypothetical protein